MTGKQKASPFMVFGFLPLLDFYPPTRFYFSPSFTNAFLAFFRIAFESRLKFKVPRAKDNCL